MLNLAEEAFSTLKQRVKMTLAARRDEVIALLFEIIANSVEVITPAKANAWWLHSLTFYPKCKPRSINGVFQLHYIS